MVIKMKSGMSKREFIKRCLLLVAGLFLSGIGVAITKHGELGVSPISSVANVVSCKYTMISIGTWLIIWNCILVAGQVVVLRSKFKLYQLLQIPLSFLYGYFTDFGVWVADFIPVHSYPVQLLMVFLGIAILGLGIALSVIANVILNAGESLIKAIADTIHKEFGNVKVVFDSSCVAFAIVMSLLFFDFQLVGIREGTIIAAFMTGVSVKFFQKNLQDPLNRFCRK